MTRIESRLQKAERGVHHLCPPSKTEADLRHEWLAEIRRYGRFFPLGSVLAGLNDRKYRQAYALVVEGMELPYKEMVVEAFDAFGNHPAWRLLEYAISVGGRYLACASLRIPPPLCEWVLKFDAEEWKNDKAIEPHLEARDACNGCAVCYPIIYPAVCREDRIYTRPFKTVPCFDCTGVIVGESEVGRNAALHERSRSWREIYAAVQNRELAHELDWESWDWEAILTSLQPDVSAAPGAQRLKVAK